MYIHLCCAGARLTLRKILVCAWTLEHRVAASMSLLGRANSQDLSCSLSAVVMRTDAARDLCSVISGSKKHTIRTLLQLDAEFQAPSGEATQDIPKPLYQIRPIHHLSPRSAYGSANTKRVASHDHALKSSSMRKTLRLGLSLIHADVRETLRILHTS